MAALITLLAAPMTVTIDDMHGAYGTIFTTGNRNAASHLWASYILNQASTMETQEMVTLFTGFCPVSGSPVSPGPANTYHYSLRTMAGEQHVNGFVHHCCAPCVCDTTDLVRADTKTIGLAGGRRAVFTFAVIGNPCIHAERLLQTFNDPFGRGSETLSAQAPEVQCDGSTLRGATMSDNGGVIIGLLEQPAPALDTPADPVSPNRLVTVDERSFHDTRDFAEYCSQRAESGYNSGMGLIFRLVAEINPIARASTAVIAAPPPSPSPSAECGGILSEARVAEINAMIASEPVMIFGMAHTRCLAAASERLEAAGACFRLESWSNSDEPLWRYMQCKHPHEIVNGMMMHSYVYVGGSFLGNGFALRGEAMSENDLTSRLRAAGAKMECSRQCESLAPQSDRDELARMMEAPLALLGWQNCPCVGIARNRFESVGACYVQRIWPTDTAPLYKYLQCVHGSHHHSFVFIGGRFVGDGFALQESAMDQPAFTSAVKGAQASLMCQRRGDENLFSTPLKSCTQSTDGSTTGWTRSGSCNWSPDDHGYHEVCVTMSDEFLRKSATHDANDLSSVVQAGGHWCICAWAWASAVQRDPSNYEGITLDCERTNSKLREVYDSYIQAGADLTSPSGAAYRAKTALDAVNKVCNSSTVAPAVATTAATAAAVTTKSRKSRGAAAVAGAAASAGKTSVPNAILIVAVPVGMLLLGAYKFRRRVVPSEVAQLTKAEDKASDAEDKLGAYDSALSDEEPMLVGKTPATGQAMRVTGI